MKLEKQDSERSVQTDVGESGDDTSESNIIKSCPYKPRKIIRNLRQSS
jgi:hypothetical protein